MKKYLLAVLVFALAFTVSLTASASTELPSPFSVLDEYDYKYSFIIKQGNQETIHLFATTNLPTWTGTGLSISGSYVEWRLSDGQWAYYSSGKRDDGMVWYSYNCLWTSHDIPHVNGTIYAEHDPNFFPMPLHQVVLTVAGEQIAVEMPKMGGTVMTIVCCGVGLMALLISLPLLRKVFSQFLN